MIAYRNTSKGFIEDVETNTISKKIKDAVLKAFNWKKIRENEESSWANSLQFMGNVIRRSGIAEDCGILIEYNLPSTSLRVDFIITGENEAGKPNFIIVELKQWKEAQSTSKDGVVYTKYHGFENHPSYQAYSYKLYLKDFNENIYQSTIQAHSCAYLHNYEEKTPEPLKDKIYHSIVQDSPLYLKDDQIELEQFIKAYVGKGKGDKILYSIENGNIKPSKKLIDYVTELFNGNPEFILLDDQKVAFETAKELALKAEHKTVIIINGGPGTGKSVISMNLLGLLRKNKNVVFVAPNASFREVMLEKLTRDYDKRRISHLLKGSGSFYGARKNTFDVLVIDEAHRLKKAGAFMYQGKNQVEDVIHASKVSIFFIDDKQMIRPEDIGTVAEIERVANKEGAQIHKLNLKAQFRCSGAEGFINWIEDVLHLESTGNFDGWDQQSFEFEIFDDPNALVKQIRTKNEQGATARILAGYAWEWTSPKKGNTNAQIDDIVIPEFDFRMPWNSRAIGSTWAIDDDGLNQIGCVHTSQGLEFEYVGIIVGKDLQYSTTYDSYFTNWNDYRDSNGKKGLKANPTELNRLVRNIYRILFTRGMKGCYVYFVDKEVEKYFRYRLNTNKD